MNAKHIQTWWLILGTQKGVGPGPYTPAEDTASYSLGQSEQWNTDSVGTQDGENSFY